MYNRLIADGLLLAAALYSFWYGLKAWRESRSTQDNAHLARTLRRIGTLAFLANV